MNVANISGAGGASAATWASPMAGGRHDDQYQSAMSSVATLLGTTTSALGQSTQTQSLSQLAASRGVSADQLRAAIESGLQQAGTKLTGTRLDNIADRIANHRPRHHHSGGAGAASSSGTSPSATGWAATGGLDVTA